MAGGSLMIGNFNAGSFVVSLGSSYLLGRLTAQDGPRLDNLAAAGGDYGVPMPRAYGERVRLAGIVIAQDDIKETKHEIEDYSEIVGALTGAAQGFMIGGPIGAIAGGILGGLFGAATPDQHFYTYSIPAVALLFCDRTDDEPIQGVEKLWANGKLIYGGGASRNRFFRSMTVYPGSSGQGVDPTLAAELGEDGAYPFSAYIVIKELQLEAFGNAMPPIEGLVNVAAGQTLADVAEMFCTAAGIDPDHDVSTTALTSSTIRGYAITSETTCWDALKPLLPVYGVDCAEVAGQLRFYRRSQSMRATVPQVDMGAHIYGDEAPERFMFRRATDLDLPRETSLTFVDPDRDYQPNTATSARTEGNAASNVAVTLPLVLTADEGASAAALMHWDAWLGRTQASFTLTDAWRPEVGLAYGIPVGGEVVPYRFTRVTRGANGINEIEALSDESVTYTASLAGTSGTIPDEESPDFPDTRLVLMDMPITADDHDDYGFYVAMAGSERYWTRGRIEASSDGTNFVGLIDSPQSAVIGDVTGTLAAGTTTGLDDTLDTTSVLTIVLLHDGMEMASATDEQLDNWANFAFVGKNGLGEYLQFKTATKVGFATWQLTNLRRGRKGTDHAIGSHSSGEEFVLLGGAGVFRIIYSDPSQWGNGLTFRGVTLHQDEADAEEVAFTNTGEGKRPYSPVNVEGSWDGSNNLTATFDSRSRLNSGGLGIDDNAEWDVEITSGAGRSMTVVAETFSYSAADQIIDGILPGDSIAGRVRQTSDVNDGRWRNFLLIGPDDTWELEDDLTSIHLEDGATPLELE